MGLEQRWRFLRGYLQTPHVVGALSPSSKALAEALCEPYHRAERPASVLEVGAGTGAITRYLGTILREQDKLDVCEIHPDFATILRRDVLSRPEFAPAVSSGRVRLLQAAVQDLPAENSYDYIISCLPFNAFELGDVQDVFGVLRRSLRPGGILSYFEYMGLRHTSRYLSVGQRRRRIRSVSRYMNQNIREHQFDRRAVLRNFPPACARYLRFES